MNRFHAYSMLLILAVIALAGSLAAYMTMHRATRVSVIRAEAARLSATSSQYDKSQSNAIAKLSADTAADRARLRSEFIPYDQAVSFIDSIEALSNESGGAVALSSINADDLGSSPSGTVGNIQAHVEAKGSWVAAMKTLMLAENLPYQVSISNVRFNTSGLGAKDKPLQWELTFDIRAAIFKP